MKEPLLREAAADCIHEIITKGMDPVTKTQLIESFVTVLDQAGVLKPVDVSIGEVQVWYIIVDLAQFIIPKLLSLNFSSVMRKMRTKGEKPS